MPLMDIFPATKALRKVTPGNARPISIQHRLDKQTIILAAHPDIAILAGNKLRNPLPLIIAKAIAPHRSAPFMLTSYESSFAPRRNPLFEDTP